MKLTKLGPNTTEIEVGDWTILFSYKTPVAGHKVGFGYYKTSEKWSVTTSKHISQWLDGAPVEERPQEFFNNIARRIS